MKRRDEFHQAAVVGCSYDATLENAKAETKQYVDKLDAKKEQEIREYTAAMKKIVDAEEKDFFCPICKGPHTLTRKEFQNLRVDTEKVLCFERRVRYSPCPWCDSEVKIGGSFQLNWRAPWTVIKNFARRLSSPDTSIRAYPNQPSLGYKLKSCLGTFLAIGIIGGILGFAVYIAVGGKQPSFMHDDYNNGYYEDYDGGYADHEESIYVEPLGRTVYWDDEYECYYDPETECYFFKNYEFDPPVWQYWFEGVSSDYGSDYGWMEWDYNERCWYVQKSKNSWVKLPEREYTDWLWHFD